MFANLNIRARFSDGGPPVGVRRLMRIATVESQRPGETFADAQSASLRCSAPWDLGSGNTTGLAAIRPPPDEVGNAPLPPRLARFSISVRYHRPRRRLLRPFVFSQSQGKTAAQKKRST
jgi:hypothetical protein